MKTCVCAIFVTYNPEESFLENLQIVLKQVEQIIVVDNHTNNQFLIDKAAALPMVSIIKNNYNLGIASALNQGVKWAIDKNYEWVITFDQDSKPSKTMIADLFNEYNQSPNKEAIALLAPVYYDIASGYQSRFMKLEAFNHVITDLTITSGSLVKTEVFSKVGFFDDDLFIDYVDHDFCLRLKAKGFLSVIIPKARLGQTLGDAQQHWLGLFSFFTHNYSPARRYYMARNRLILYRRHWQFKGWIVQDLIFSLKEFIKIVFIEKDKWLKIKFLLLGTIDGILGRKGSLDGVTYSMPKASKYFVEFREEIIPLFSKPVDKLLDIGCGSGETSAELKRLGKTNWVCGVEYNNSAANVARTKLDQVIEGDIEKLEFPFPEGHFDAILTLDILEHLVDPWSTLEKLTKILKPGGVLIASIPNVRHFSVTLPLLFMGDWRYQEEGLLDSTHIRFFTRKTAKKLLKSSGLQVEIFDHTGAKKGSFSGFMNWLTFGLFKEFLFFQFLFRAKKPN